MWMVQKTIIIIEQTILTQVVTTSVYLIWIDDKDDGNCDDDDDGGFGDGVFFTLLFSKENRKKIQHRIFFTWSMLDTFFEFFCWWFS